MTQSIHRRQLLAGCAAATALAAFPARATAVPRYRITDLGDLGGPSIRVCGLNDLGAVTGMATRHGPDHYGVAFLSENGRMRGLKWEGFPTLGQAINSRGQITVRNAPPGVRYAWVWSDGALRQIQGPLGTAIRANGINEAGQVTGEISDDQGYVDSGGSMVLIPRPADFDYIGCQAINNHGVVAGCYYHRFTNIGGRAFIWANGQMTTLQITDAFSHTAFDINDVGQVCGSSYRDLDSRARAFIWHEGQTVHLPNLGSHKGSSSRASAINNAGVVAGTSTRRRGQGLSPDHATVWHGHQPYALDDLADEASAGWVMLSAVDINNSGRVVGQGLFNGVERGFLATPV